MRRASHERRILGEDPRRRLGHQAGDIGFESIPNVEEKGRTRPEDAADLTIGGQLVGKEHHDILAEGQIETGDLEG